MPLTVRTIAGLALAASTACGDEACDRASFDYRNGAVVEHRDQLQAYEGRCVIVLGALDIVGDRIEDLAGLEGVVGVHGKLRIASESLTSTAELSALEYVMGDLSIGRAPSLERIELPSLRSVGLDLRIGLLPRLLDFEGLDALETVGGSVVLRDLDAMSTMALPALHRIGGTLYVENNWQLRDLVEPDALFEIGGNLRIRSNPSLRTVSGFDGLDRVGGTIRIGGNAERWYRHRWEPLDEREPPQPGSVRGVRIDTNAELEEVRGFGALRSLWSFPFSSSQHIATFSVIGNRALRSVDAFGGLSGATSATPPWRHDIFMTVRGNPALQRLPRFAPLHDPLQTIRVSLVLEDNERLESTADGSAWTVSSVAVRNNPSLRSLAGLRLEQPSYIAIEGNDTLTTLDGIELRGANEYGTSVRIERNAALQNLSALVDAREYGAHYGDVVVLYNDVLTQADAVAVVDAMGIDDAKIAGNAGWITEEVCSYVEDNECDEALAFGRRICAVGSDASDCEP